MHAITLTDLRQGEKGSSRPLSFTKGENKGGALSDGGVVISQSDPS